MKIKKQDWIILRLMYLIMALDPKMLQLDELIRTKKYLEKRYRPYREGSSDDVVQRAFALIARDPIAQDSFSHVKDVDLIRYFDTTLTETKEPKNNWTNPQHWSWK